MPNQNHITSSSCLKSNCGVIRGGWTSTTNWHLYSSCNVCGLASENTQFFANLFMPFQVFQCNHERCGHFYHPNCVAKLIHPDSENRAKLEQHIVGGLEFDCPMHQCKLCKETENKDDKEMRFAVCRRCPTAYHSKCLPRFLLSLENGDSPSLFLVMLHSCKKDSLSSQLRVL
jgi:hypothetical protein